MKPNASGPPSLSDSLEVAGTGAQFGSAPVKYKEVLGVDDFDDYTEPVAPEQDHGVKSRSGRKGRKGPLRQKHREHAALVRRSGACAACRLRKVQVCTNTRRPRFSLLTGL